MSNPLDVLIADESVRVRQAICLEANSWLGTPFLHQGRVKGERGGVDCAMLVACIAHNCGLISKRTLDFVPSNYSAEWYLHNEEETLLDTMKMFGCVEKNKQNRLPGDILVYRFAEGKAVSHVGLQVEDNYMVHAYIERKKVLMHSVRAMWVKKMSHVFSLPGVE